MKNLKKINRIQLKSIIGGAKGVVTEQACDSTCCPPPGVFRCPSSCYFVVCPPPDLNE